MLSAVSTQSFARTVAGLALVMLGLWVLHGFIVPLLWAVILTIATYPLYLRLQEWLGERNHLGWSPLVMTLLLGIALIGPVAYGLVLLGFEAKSLAPQLVQAQRVGLPVPDWLGQIPLFGSWAEGVWNQTLGSREAVQETLQQLGQSSAVDWTRHVAAQLVHRTIAVGFTLLAVYFLYKNAEELAKDALALFNRWFGNVGTRYATNALDAVRATVNGLVLVGLGQALLLAVLYFLAGIPHPVLSGTVTGLASMIPFVAPVILAGAVLFLIMHGAMLNAIVVASVGAVVLFAADHFVRPVLIGGAGKLPFLWVLLGILGGMETFGLLGLFVGPTVMAVLISLWRDSAAESA